jgi:hypothetical protein
MITNVKIAARSLGGELLILEARGPDQKRSSFELTRLSNELGHFRNWHFGGSKLFKDVNRIARPPDGKGERTTELTKVCGAPAFLRTEHPLFCATGKTPSRPQESHCETVVRCETLHLPRDFFSDVEFG